MAITSSRIRHRHLRRRQARRAQLAALPSGVKNEALEAIADALIERTPEILEANAAISRPGARPA